MHIDDDDASQLKNWVIKKIAGISDADSDVLADYVLALIRTDTPEPQHRQDVLENLEDFLKDETTAFVNDVFKAIQTKSYKPGYVAPLPAKPLPIQSLNPIKTVGEESPRVPQSRKRSYNESAGNEAGGDSHYAQDERQKRHIRGGRGGRGGFRGRGRLDTNGYSQSGSPQGFPTLPQLPPGLGFDPNDPMAAMMAMQAMGLPPLPNMPGFPQAGSPSNQSHFNQNPGGFANGRKEKCADYETKGFCLRGDSCPFLHSDDRVVVPGIDAEYDPKDASLMDTSPTSPISAGFSRGQGQGRGQGRGRGRGDKGGFQPRRNRAEFSQAGPNHDRSITTIVVEQIPEEKFDEQSVRDFFAEFGNIEEVTMQPYKRLALVKFDDWAAAKRAYDSPKVIFDNRFVKVYWYKPGGVPTPRPTSNTPAAHQATSPPKDAEEETFDREKFEQSSQAAQKKLEEKKAQQQEVAAKRSALERLAAEQAAERQKLLDRLAAKGISTPSDTNDAVMSDAPVKPNGSSSSPPPATDDSRTSEHTKLLRAKVAELEAEAKSLGLDASLADPSTSSWSARGRGRGSIRGRGSYRGWEAFDPSFRGGRGGYRGRGYPFAGSPAGGGKYNLDNRTKRVGVALPTSSAAGGTEWTSEKDEALRQWLLGLGEFEDVSPAPPKPSGTANGTNTAGEETTVQQIITFKDRATAEAFLFGGSRERDVAGLGKVGLSWWNGPAPTSSEQQAAPSSTDNDDHGDADQSMGLDEGGKTKASGEGTGQQQAEVDYDVAEEEEDDRWMDG